MIQPLILGDSLELLIDNRGKNPPYSDSGVPAVSGMSVTRGVLDLSSAKYVSAETWEKWMPQPTRRHDVILTSEAPLGRAVLIDDDKPLVLAQRVFGLRGRVGILDSRYLYYAFQTSEVQADLQGRATGTTVLGIRQPALKGVVIPAPSYDEQRAIAEILGALDDKIDANTKLVERADRLQHMKFRSMLADSEPVPLSETARFVNGKAFTKGASGTGRVVIRIAELNSGLSGSTVYSDAEVAGEHLASPGDILFAWSGSLTLHRWFRSPGIVNQHIFKVMPNDPYPHWLVYELIREKLDEFKAIAANKATTMGRIQRRHLDEEVRVPKEAVWKAQSGLMENLWSIALNAEQENLALATTRDTLLPQLMSGKLRVKDAADVVGSLV